MLYRDIGTIYLWESSSNNNCFQQGLWIVQSTRDWFLERHFILFFNVIFYHSSTTARLIHWLIYAKSGEACEPFQAAQRVHHYTHMASSQCTTCQTQCVIQLSVLCSLLCCVPAATLLTWKVRCYLLLLLPLALLLAFQKPHLHLQRSIHL